MRIVHITEAFGGGLRTAIVNYSLATPHHEHTVFSRLREGYETFGLPDGVVVEHYSGSIANFFRAARNFVGTGDFDVVHLHSSYAGVLRAWLPRTTRIVYSPHCFSMETDRAAVVRGAFWVVERTLAQRPQLLLAVSPHEVDIGRRLNPRMLNHVVRNAAPVAGETPHRKSAQRPTIAMFGRICHQKDPRFFAEVCTTLGHSRFRYLWIGDGDDHRDALLRAGVEITGWVSPQRAREFLAEAELLVHTAKWEGGPLATLEAADAGCPVIARTIPSMQSLGYHVVGKSPQEVAAAAERFFTDPDYRDVVITQTSAVLADCSFERMSEELSAAYAIAMAKLGPASTFNRRQPRTEAFGRVHGTGQ